MGVLESPGAPVLAERATGEGLPTILLPASLGAAWRSLRALLAQGTFDIVHSHGYKTDVLAAIPVGRGEPQRVATCHGWLSNTLKLKAYERLDRLVLRRFDQVVAVSPQVLAKLELAGIRAERRSLVENGVQTPHVSLGARKRVRDELAPRGERLVVRVGRLDYVKGNDTLLRALSLLAAPSVRLAFVGEGNELGYLTSIANRLGLADQVAFVGYRTDVPDILSAADLMVISSLSEGLPMVMLEAMALGVPIVSASVGSIPHVLRDGESGWLVPPGDAAALARTIAAVLGNHDVARSRARAAQADYIERYSREAMGLRYEAVYAKVLAGQAVDRATK